MPDQFAVFIDGAHLTKHTQNERLDYRVFRSWFEKHLNATMAVGYYFDADMTGERSKFQHVLQRHCGLRVKNYWHQESEIYWPEKMGGGKVVHPTTGAPYILSRQKAVDVALGFHLALSHVRDKWNHLVLVAGDSDFICPVQTLTEFFNVKMTLISSSDSLSPQIMSYASEVILLEDRDSDFMQSLVMKNGHGAHSGK